MRAGSGVSDGGVRRAGVEVVHEKVALGSFSHLARDRSGFQGEFVRRVLAEPGLKGRVLDVGCGPGPQPVVEEVLRSAGRVDGVDPVEQAQPQPLLANRWRGTLEELPLGAGTYDLAFSYNVVEHVREARPFFEKVRRVLKPGGVFWALTPHGRHPFCTAVKLLEWSNLKQKVGSADYQRNAYRSYYRLNRDKDVLRAIEGLGFSSARFVYMPCMQWDRAFPRPMRFLPWAYDWVAGTRFGRSMLILAYRLEVAREVGGESGNASRVG